jgi:hypothetical protein
LQILDQPPASLPKPRLTGAAKAELFVEIQGIYFDISWGGLNRIFH